MSIGLGVFLSALLFSLLYLYSMTRDRWNWKRFARWTLIAVGGLLLIGGLWLGGPSAYEKIRGPQPQTKYADLQLGSKMSDVEYIKGYPPEVLQNPEDVKSTDNNPFDALVVIERKDFTADQHLENFRSWQYSDIGAGGRLDVDFDAPTKTLNSIMCYSTGTMNCPELFGIYDGTVEDNIIEQLGKPSSEKIEGVAKTIRYDDLNVWFYLEQRKVYMLGIRSARPVDRPPPCKNGAETCHPWERDWSKVGLTPGSAVTEDGVVTRPAGSK